ncbi:MAG: DegV family protein [Clostridia bacterium]|nr:DegV family protein [Clostridia bacterium]
MKVAVVTDSNSGITQKLAEDIGVYVVPMPVLIDGEQFFEGVTLSQEQFYERLKTAERISTSQPSAFDVGELWKKILKTHDAIVHIPMSSGLSQTCTSLTRVAETEFAGKVFVVDNQRISITQRQSVYDAVTMAKKGKSAKDIYKWLMKTKMQSSIYIMVDTLKYLKKGGRLTPAVAAIGTLLHIKPVLQIQGDKLDNFAKVRKLSAAKDVMLKAIKKDFETRFINEVKSGKMTLCVAHTQNESEAIKFAEEIKALYPAVEFTFIDPLSLSVSCHIGPGALAVACSVKY